MAPDPTQARDAVEEMQRVLDVGPAVPIEVPCGGAQLTPRWGHGAIHDRTVPMRSHVAMTYFGAPQRIEWRAGSRTQRSLTRSGTITLIPSTHEARWDVYGPIEVSHVYLSSARLETCARAMGAAVPIELLDRVGAHDPVASRLLEILAIEAEAPDPSGRLMHDELVDLLAMQLVRAHSTFMCSPQIIKPQGLSARQVKLITDYLVEHVHEQVGLDELANLVGLSRFHVCKAFRQATGVPPHRWLTLRRMADAKQLLCKTELSVAEIGMALGYQSPSAFIAMVRKLTGATPLQFRRQH